MNNQRLIVERLESQALRQRGLELLNQIVNFVRDLQRVAIGLAAHVQENGWFPVRSDHRIHGRNRWSDARDIADSYRHTRRRSFHYNLSELLGRANLSAHK